MTPRCSPWAILEIMVPLPTWGKTRKGQVGSRMEIKAPPWTFEKPIRQATTTVPGSLQIVLHILTNCIHNSYSNCVVEKDSHCPRITVEEMKALKDWATCPKWGLVTQVESTDVSWGWRYALGSVLTWDHMRPPNVRRKRSQGLRALGSLCSNISAYCMALSKWLQSISGSNPTSVIKGGKLAQESQTLILLGTGNNVISEVGRVW